MRRPRPKLTYANVVSTLALFLAFSGGAVWAANKITSKQIGKGAVKTKNLAKGAVKTKNLAKNAVKAKKLAKNSVSSAKLAKGAVKNAKLADGAVNFAKLAAGTNVIASATGGPVPVQDGPVDVPLNPPLTVTAVAGQPITLNIEVRGSIARSGAEQCAVFFLPLVNGTPALLGESLILVAADGSENPITGKGVPRASAAFPLGLTSPGEPLAVSLQLISDAADCTPSSTIDQVAVVATRLK